MSIKERVNEILVNNGLDFEIKKLPLIANNEEGSQLITPYYGLFNSKTNECINTCKSGYTISQNCDLIETVLNSISKYSDRLIISKAGSLNGGRRIFVQLRVNDRVNSIISKERSYKLNWFINILDSNDGSTGLSGLIGVELDGNIFYLEVPKLPKFRHTSKIEASIINVNRIIELCLNYMDDLYIKFDSFKSIKVDIGLIDLFVKAIFGFNQHDTNLTIRSIRNMDNLYSCINRTSPTLLSLIVGLSKYTNEFQKSINRDNSLDESLICGIGFKKMLIGYLFCDKFCFLKK